MRLEYVWILVYARGPGTSPLCIPRKNCTIGFYVKMFYFGEVIFNGPFYLPKDML